MGWIEGIQGLDNWNGGHLGVRCGDLVQWKFPGLYEGDPNEDS